MKTKWVKIVNNLCSMLTNQLVDLRFGFRPRAIDCQIAEWVWEFNCSGVWQTEGLSTNNRMLIIAGFCLPSVDLIIVRAGLLVGKSLVEVYHGFRALGPASAA